jgi:hypothetical protein
VDAPQLGKALAVEDVEGKPELGLELILPLQGHGGWRCDQHKVDAAAEQEFA